MLQQALRRLQQLDAAADIAVAAAESADAAAFLAVRTASSKADGGADKLPSWGQLRRMGAGFWLREQAVLTGIAERLAKQQFAARRNADDCALLYCALGRRSVLQVGGRGAVRCRRSSASHFVCLDASATATGVGSVACQPASDHTRAVVLYCRACTAAPRAVSRRSFWPEILQNRSTARQHRQGQLP